MWSSAGCSWCKVALGWGWGGMLRSLAEMLRSRSWPSWWLEHMVFKVGLIHGQGAGIHRVCIWSLNSQSVDSNWCAICRLWSRTVYPERQSEMCPLIILYMITCVIWLCGLWKIHVMLLQCFSVVKGAFIATSITHYSMCYECVLLRYNKKKSGHTIT